MFCFRPLPYTRYRARTERLGIRTFCASFAEQIAYKFAQLSVDDASH